MAVIANGARVAGTGIAAHYYGTVAAEGFFHEFSGWLVFIAAFAMMLMFHRLLVFFAPDRGRPLPRQPWCQRSEGSRMLIRAVVLFVIFVAASGAIARAQRTEQVPVRQSFSALPMTLE